MSIVLISLYELDSYPLRIFHAILEKSGFEVYSIFFKRRNPDGTLDFALDQEIEILVKLLKEKKASLVGINVKSTLFKFASRITNRIKEELNVKVIWGGIHPTISPEQCIEIADIVCVGEGEEAILELAARLSKKKSIKNIKNLWVRSNGKVIKNQLRPLQQNLDLIPFPDYSNSQKYMINNGAITPMPKYRSRIRYRIMTSRGCHFNCTYCANHLLKKIYPGKYVRRRSVENVIKELMLAKKNFPNLQTIMIEDDTFMFDINWIRRFSKLYKEKIALPFWCYTPANFNNEEMLVLLKYAGLSVSTVSIETGSERIRKKYYKRFETNKQIISTSKLLKKYGIIRLHNLIIENPLETQNDKEQTLDLLLNLPKPFLLMLHSLVYFPKTEITETLLKQKIISSSDLEDQKEIVYRKWLLRLDLDEDQSKIFEHLYVLCGKKHIPRALVLWLSRNAFLKKHPAILTRFIRIFEVYRPTFSNLYLLYDKKYIPHFFVSFLSKISDLRANYFYKSQN